MAAPRVSSIFKIPQIDVQYFTTCNATEPIPDILVVKPTQARSRKEEKILRIKGPKGRPRKLQPDQVQVQLEQAFAELDINKFPAEVSEQLQPSFDFLNAASN